MPPAPGWATRSMSASSESALSVTTKSRAREDLVARDERRLGVVRDARPLRDVLRGVWCLAERVSVRFVRVLAPPLTGGRKPTSSPPFNTVSGLARRWLTENAARILATRGFLAIVV